MSKWNTNGEIKEGIYVVTYIEPTYRTETIRVAHGKMVAGKQEWIMNPEGLVRHEFITAWMEAPEVYVMKAKEVNVEPVKENAVELVSEDAPKKANKKKSVKNKEETK